MVSIIKNDELFNSSKYYTALTDATDNQYHRHEFFESFYVVSGQVNHSINGKKEILKPLTLYLLRPDDFHSFSSYNNETYIHRDICLTAESFKEICDFLSPSYYDTIINSSAPFKIVLAPETIKFFEQQFNNLDPVQNKNLAFQELLFKNIVSNVLFFLFTQHTQLQRSVPTWIQRLAGLLQNPYNFSNSIPNILKEFHYTQPYICNCFKKYMGCTLTEYFTKAKLTYANFLILSTTLPISSIAEKAGYTNISFFNREFKAYYDQTPSSMRKWYDELSN